MATSVEVSRIGQAGWGGGVVPPEREEMGQEV